MHRTAAATIPVLLLSACDLVDRPLLDVPVTLEGAPDATWELADGSTLTLDLAVLALTDLRLESTPLVTLHTPTLFPTAWAHPGHGTAGVVVGELLGEWTVDLLAGPTELGHAHVYAGKADRFRLGFDALPNHEGLPGATACLAGTVTHSDGTTQAVRWEAVPVGVDGARIDAQITDGTELSLAVDLDHALSFVEPSSPTDSLAFGLAHPATWQSAVETP